MGESKLRKKLGIGRSQKMMTVGIVATRWDAYPDVPVATTMFTMSIRDIKKFGAVSVDKGELVQQIGEGFSRGTNQSPEFAALCAAYIAKTQTFAAAVDLGLDGVWMKLLDRAGHYMARPYGMTLGSEIFKRMTAVRDETMTDAERLEWVYSTHPNDVSITGVKLK